jgi:hypothetical protein
MKLGKKSISTVLVLIGLVIMFLIISQMYPAEEQIFITDSYFITPKTQPFLYVLLGFASFGAIIFAVFLGRIITAFLWSKGLLAPVVGIFLIFAAGVLGYVSLFLQQNVKDTTGFVVMLSIVLFLGGFGVWALFSWILNKKNNE